MTERLFYLAGKTNSVFRKHPEMVGGSAVLLGLYLQRASIDTSFSIASSRCSASSSPVESSWSSGIPVVF